MSNKVHLGFAQIMGPCLCICKDREVCSSKEHIKLQSDHICFFARKQNSLKSDKHSNKLRMSFFFIRKSAKSCHISLFVMETPCINNVFLFLVNQYFIETLESILKLFQGFWIFLLKSTPKQIWKSSYMFVFI